MSARNDWYYIHSLSKGYLVEIDKNGRSIYQANLFPGMCLWLTNNQRLACQMARNRNARYFRVSDWLRERITPKLFVSERKS